MGRLTVMTQNIFGGGPGWRVRRALLARRMRQLRPDIIALQEVHAQGASGPSQAHQLAAALGGYHVDFAPGRVTEGGACEGVALLCRTGIRERSVVALTLDRRDFLDRAGQRVVLCASLDLPEGPLDIFATHLSLSRRARGRTVRELLGFADRERARSGSRAAVLLGDLNALPGEPALRALEEESAGGPWADAWRLCHGGEPGGTWPALAPRRRIDYIFVQPPDRVVVERCEREPLSGSDHRGVTAALDLRL